MILEFLDGTQLEVITILGGPANVDGLIRDVLTVEIESGSIPLAELRLLFENAPNLSKLYTYEEERNEDDDIFMNKIEIGEGYTIVLGIETVKRKILSFPGKIVPETFEYIFQVQLAQMTYDEWIASEYSSIE